MPGPFLQKPVRVFDRPQEAMFGIFTECSQQSIVAMLWRCGRKAAVFLLMCNQSTWIGKPDVYRLVLAAA